VIVALEQVNQQIAEAFKEIQPVLTDNLDEAEKLVQTLQNLLLQRQKLLRQWLPTTVDEDRQELLQQQRLTQDYERHMMVFRKHYGDTLVAKKRNERKLDLYKTLDAQR